MGKIIQSLGLDTEFKIKKSNERKNFLNTLNILSLQPLKVN